MNLQSEPVAQSPIVSEVPSSTNNSGVTPFSLTRVFLLFLATILAMSISYYFVVALPNADKQRLAFEQQKYRDSQKEKVAKEAEEKDKQDFQKAMVSACKGDAETSYLSYVKLNGQPVPGQPGTYTAAQAVWDYADRRKTAMINECYRQYSK
jgi:hypothetical protein